MRAIFILPRYPGELPPLPLKLFLSESWNQNAVSLDGWRVPLTHQNSSIGTSLLLDHFQAGPYPFSNAILIPVGEACTTDGECKPQITDGDNRGLDGHSELFQPLCMGELGFKHRQRQVPSFEWVVDFTRGVSAE